VMTENPTVCPTVNCKVCGIALSLPVVPSWMYKPSINLMILSETRLISHEQP
jgi:hypothetical protein